jgi:hypothetical protein
LGAVPTDCGAQQGLANKPIRFHLQKRMSPTRKPFRFPGRLDIGKLLLLSLVFIMSQHLANSLFIPARRKLLIGHRGFLRCRRR